MTLPRAPADVTFEVIKSVADRVLSGQITRDQAVTILLAGIVGMYSVEPPPTLEALRGAIAALQRLEQGLSW